MATAISKNQYDYLNNLVSGGGGNGEWAKSQLANSTYTPPAPMTTTPSVPTNMNVPPSPAQASTVAKVPTSNVPVPPASPTATAAAPKTNPAVQQYADFQKQQTDLMSQLNSYMQPMNYDPNTDPRYLAAKQLASAGAKDASFAAMESLNDRGILNSSVTRDDVAGIEQQYAAQVAAQIPQFYAQAYQQQRDRVADVFNLLQNSQNQQQRSFDNMNTDRNFGLNQGQATGYYTPDAGTMDSVRAKMAENSAAYANASPEEQRRLHEENVKLAASIGGLDTTGNGDYAYGPLRTVQGQQLDLNQKIDERNFNYQKVRDAVADDKWTTEVDNEMKKWAESNKLNWSTFDLNTKKALADIAISQQNANTSAASAGNASARLAWDMDPNNPDNLYKMSQINKSSVKTTDYKTNPDFAQDVAFVKSNPAAAAQLDSHAQDFINQYGYDGYVALRKAAGLDD